MTRLKKKEESIRRKLQKNREKREKFRIQIMKLMAEELNLKTQLSMLKT